MKQQIRQIIHPILVKARLYGVRMIATDIDWTLRDPRDPKFNFRAIRTLCLRTAKKGIIMLLLTGRDASLQRDFIQKLAYSLVKRHITTPIYAGCANGVSLYKISKNGVLTLYRNELTPKQTDTCISAVLAAIQSLQIQRSYFQERGRTVFSKFLSSSWGRIIPKKFITKVKKYNGILFLEPSKLSFVLPKNVALRNQLIKIVQAKLPPFFNLQFDQEFAHVSRRFLGRSRHTIDKMFALNYIRKIEDIKLNEIVVFGGALDEIDRNMLSSCPYSFSSQHQYIPNDNSLPPFKLIGKKTPVGLVHEAINYLLS